MQYLGLFFTFTFPGILVGILLAASKFFEDAPKLHTGCRCPSCRKENDNLVIISRLMRSGR